MDELEFASRYKRAFSSLDMEKGFEVNLENGKLKRRWSKGLVTAFAAIALLFTCTTVYAENVGGIQRKIQIWIDGELTTATVDFSKEGSYTIYDTDGNEIMNGGGIAYEGILKKERPLTADELMEEMLDNVTLEESGGKYYVHWHDKTMILDDSSFGSDGYAYITLIDDNTVEYVTINRRGDYASSPDKYPIPGKDFN